MNPNFSRLAKILGGVALVAVAGCATTETDSALPRPGDGVREYQQHVSDFRATLAESVQAVEKLAASSEKSSSSAYARVQSTAQQLEVVSIKARARAEALEVRGEEYFHEWREEACASGDERARREARARFDGLRGHFASVQQDSRRVREDSRKFFENLRRWRAKLGAAPDPAVIESARAEFSPAATAGKAALAAVDRLSQTLKAAELAVMKAAQP